MTIRAYIAHTVPTENLSINKKRELIQLERKNVSRVVFREPLKLMIIYYENGEKEFFKYGECEVEILKKEPTDGLTNRFQLPF